MKPRLVVFLIFIGSALLNYSCDSSKAELQAKNDSLCSDARRIAIQEFNRKDFLIDNPALGDFPNYTEEILYTQYALKIAVRSNVVIECGTGLVGMPRANRCYVSTIDSLLIVTYGSDIYEVLARKADSFRQASPMRYGNDCFYAPSYIPDNDSLYADLRKVIEYPVSAIRDSVSGTVYLNLEIDSSGEVASASVRKGIRPDLDSAAIEGALKLGKFRTRFRWGESQSVYTTIPVKFVLQ